jgi:hypothetical protein
MAMLVEARASRTISRPDTKPMLTRIEEPAIGRDPRCRPW